MIQLGNCYFKEGGEFLTDLSHELVRPLTASETGEIQLALAELHIAHLMNQRNDAIDSAEDCRRKLVARYLFRKLAREHRLTKQWASFDKGRSNFGAMTSTQLISS
ncbi:hypothetical protein EYZ11_005118 [Aspergillus tanneri]|uniref:Uncharacterized protein n=1 Tax=Aspergillus tanneri TaxID=1220188 RepID=A0A4V3UPJ5_9EURO|nr:hypothetical protein EYZ11_005118 [Aspergillus tanneri]